ncbi:phosphotransferase [Gordonia jinhuaensis]|uniref:Aminoglycoside phosphotransferase n=1 Tax=Gordonia jinhuaensis TaxID=1517702 RepID=A0A916SX58_9ACTN|nr:phosphotransferase [Gordonia jinhuaensis]GGB20494.1 aminoglycoside phosphotransferase [Gordonia jinhuaensis]
MTTSMDHAKKFAAVAASAFGLADARLTCLGMSENATFLAEDGTERIVLRVHRPGYHSRVAIESELDWMTALRRDTGIATAQVVPALSGERVIDVRPGGSEVSRFVSAFGFIEGATAEERPDAIGYRDLGEITATMHDHVRSWTVPQHFSRFRWDLSTTLGAAGRWGRWQDAPGMTPEYAAAIAPAVRLVASRLRDYGTTPDRFGLVHADLRHSNLMLDDAGEITVIDFDDSGWTWLLADLAAVVSWIEGSDEAEEMIAEWMRGYRSVRVLDHVHRAMVPTFVMLRRLMLTAWIGTHPEADIARVVTDGFACGTADVAQRYVSDSHWLADACDVSTRVIASTDTGMSIAVGEAAMAASG